MKKYFFEYVEFPGRYMNPTRLVSLVNDIRDCASTCFDTLPEYQCIKGTREEMSDKIISLAYREDGVLAGFCSTVVLPVDHIGKVLHLGLTCVRPEDRGGKLTHKLMTKVLVNYIFRKKPIGKLWITNCACVLSSLGNVAMYFDNIYPSPFGLKTPTWKHHLIANTIDHHYREKMYILPDAKFDSEHFVFRGSVSNTPFEKSTEDRKYYHRIGFLNDFYNSIMDIDRGDEVLQVGTVSALSVLKYFHRLKKAKALLGQTVPALENNRYAA
ncbi:MAG: hypothetical protein N3B13_01145 [Deltaproteobacteria bacterium]|nr:hypothetical protein [Deltaproteobacteria bacterium]